MMVRSSARYGRENTLICDQWSHPIGDLSPFLLLDRKLHFGDVVARVHVLRMLEMNQAGGGQEPGPRFLYPNGQGHGGPNAGKILSPVKRANQLIAPRSSGT